MTAGTRQRTDPGEEEPDAIDIAVRGAIAAVEERAERIVEPAGAQPVTWRVWGAGRPVVLLHGGFGSWLHWIRTIPALEPRFRVIVPDLPGYGDSRGPTPPDYYSPAVIDLVAAAVDALVPPPATLDLVGFSFGGGVAAQLAARLGRRVGRIVLVATAGFSATVGTPAPAIKWRTIASRAGVRAAQRHNLAAIMFADPAKIDDLSVHIQSENTRRTITRLVRGRQRVVAAEVLAGHPARIDGIWGHDDNYAAAHLGERRAQLEAISPTARTHVVPGGHWVMYESADAFNRLLLDILGGAHVSRA